MGYQCFHCGNNTVNWCGDFDFADYGYEGEGIIHTCHCSSCGADIEYYIPINNEEEENTCDNCLYNVDNEYCRYFEEFPKNKCCTNWDKERN
jgi:hypothetical protein